MFEIGKVWGPKQQLLAVFERPGWAVHNRVKPCHNEVSTFCYGKDFVKAKFLNVL